MSTYNVAILGATGAVGMEVVRLLDERNFPVRSLRLLARKHDGRTCSFKRRQIPVLALDEGSFQDIDIAIFSAGSDVARQFGPVAVKAGCTVIDNSSAFRVEESVPLVVPEINGDLLHPWTTPGIIANPNCTTAITLMALWSLHQRFRVTRIIASSYQAVSGSGQKGIHELDSQIEAKQRGHDIRREVYPHQIAFNVIPSVGNLLPSGFTDEEDKLENEGRKIMDHPSFVASVTCVRVPVYRAHSVAVTAEFEQRIDVEKAIECLRLAPGLTVCEGSAYPTPIDVSGKDNCFVGRIRRDRAFDNGLSFWVVGDQLLKGAALNAVQIAEELVRR
ncbi:MAG: aspartate-semialdehyde dehydrogenase [Patescibacteria group bacterium]